MSPMTGGNGNASDVVFLMQCSYIPEWDTQITTVPVSLIHHATLEPKFSSPVLHLGLKHQICSCSLSFLK